MMFNGHVYCMFETYTTIFKTVDVAQSCAVGSEQGHILTACERVGNWYMRTVIPCRQRKTVVKLVMMIRRRRMNDVQIIAFSSIKSLL